MHQDRCRRRLNCRPVLLSGLLLLLASGTQATLSASSSAGYAEPHIESLTFFQGATGPVSSVGAVGPLGVAAASGNAAASYGALHSAATAVVGGDGQARGGAGSLWIDSVTLSSASTGAATGRATFNLSGALSSRVDGMSTAAYASSTVAAVVMVGAVQVFSVNAQLLHRNPSNSAYDIDTINVSGLNVAFVPGSLAGSYSFDMPIVLGTPFQLYASLNTEARAFGSSGVDNTQANSDFGSTGYWGGISAVQLADGTVVSDFSAQSTSGFDWAHAYSAPVPEPGTWAFMLAGIAFLGQAARRRMADR